MSNRVTKTQLIEVVSYMQKNGIDIMISWAYGRPRCYNKTKSRELSPRLSTGEMALWLNAYAMGFDAGQDKVMTTIETVTSRLPQ